MKLCYIVERYLQRMLRVLVPEYPHNFDRHTLVTNKSLPDIAKPPSRHLLAHLLQAGKGETSGVQS